MVYTKAMIILAYKRERDRKGNKRVLNSIDSPQIYRLH